LEVKWWEAGGRELLAALLQVRGEGGRKGERGGGREEGTWTVWNGVEGGGRVHLRERVLLLRF
jgi:hypothetical protein